MAQSDAREPVLLLAPSRDLGGGIERYVEGVQTALLSLGGVVQRLDYIWPGQSGSVARRFRFSCAVASAMRGLGADFRTVVMHPGLLSVAYPLASAYRTADCAVFYYGADIWAAGLCTRWVTSHGRRVRAVTISRFSASALRPIAQAALLPPGLSEAWFQKLVESDSSRQEQRDIDVLSVFRLTDWKTKGADVLLRAISQASVSGLRLRVTLAGQGPAPDDLLALIHHVPGVNLVVSPEDGQLASLYARARVVVLATRCRNGDRPTVEGFGMALQEAQVAGAPVIAPSSGATDAYLDGTTGVRLENESPEALAKALMAILLDEEYRTTLAANASSWARESFSPIRYQRAVAEVIFA